MVAAIVIIMLIPILLLVIGVIQWLVKKVI